MLAILNPIDVEITDEFLPMYTIEERPDGGYIYDSFTGYCTFTLYTPAMTLIPA